MQELVFLKLGGSLITDKTRPYTPRLDILADLASQIAAVRSRIPDLRIVLGHGSGSFGHTAAKQHRTREGVSTREGWQGFTDVWFQASALNRFVMQALHEAWIPALAFPPSSMVTASDGKVLLWETTPLGMALAAGILPVIYGDVVFDEVRGGTILSTEDLFMYLAKHFFPERILLAGLEEAVWADYPARSQRVRKVTPESFNEFRQNIGKAAGADVTGGMESKVRQMLELVQAVPGLTVRIFSGEQHGNLAFALEGQQIGTLIVES